MLILISFQTLHLKILQRLDCEGGLHLASRTPNVGARGPAIASSRRMGTRSLAVVIGAGSSIGVGIAQALADEYAVWIVGPDEEKARASAAAVRGAEPAFLDVTDPASCDRLFARAAPRDLAVVVNCACFSEPASLRARNYASWKRTIDVGLFGAMNVIASAGQVLRDLGPGRSIVSISSINARIAVPGYAAYCAVKAGLDMLTQVGALEMTPVRVNAVAPGPVQAECAAFAAFPAFLDGLKNRHPLAKRLTTPADIGRVVRFLVSEGAAWMTGQTLTVDGGVSSSHGDLPLPKDLAASLEAS
jgi:3-oxoacyl-[acyl-carrier protein] reductase